ncbi:hypothetical protein LguiB_024369 [Lonicera macranthoides]
MAGLTTTSPTKPLLSKPHPLSLSSSSSNLFFGLLKIHNPNNNSSSNLKFLISPSHLSIAARFGSGGGTFPRSGSSGSNSWSQRSNSDEDEGLDISTIKSDTVRLIDERQNMVGILPKMEALRRAEAAELDLVMLSPDADPPVVRLLDYNKYKYEQQKKKRDQQKKTAAHRMGLKELKMGYNIDVHDYAVRLKAALKFLKGGDKVKVIVNLKGRQKDFRNNAIELLKRFQTDVGELATEESKSFRERTMTLVMVPNKNYVPKAQELPKKEEDSLSTEDLSLPTKNEDSLATEDLSLPTKKEESVVTEEISAGV